MKKVIVFVALMLIILSAFTQNFADFFIKPSSADVKTEAERGIFEKFSAYKASDIEKAIRKAELERSKDITEDSRQKKINDTILKLKNGKISYRKVFAGACFVGDSLLNGLEVYNILNADSLITQVSARLSHLEDNIKKIVASNPEVVILHYGLNMLWADETGTQWFIDDYSELVLKLKESLPYTRIIVSSIFPVDTELATDEIFTHIARHNQALSKMCKDTGVEFLDSTELVEACGKEYYGTDGIHLSAGFYSKEWLPYIVKTKGITG